MIAINMIWIANALVIAILGVVVYVAVQTGPIICGAFLAGFFVCYVLFKCWRIDHDTPTIIMD